MTQTEQQEQKTGYEATTTKSGLIVQPYAAIGRQLIMEVALKGKSRFTVTVRKGRDGKPADELAEVVYHGSGELSSENFRDKIVEAVEDHLDDYSDQIDEEFPTRLKNIAANVGKHF